MSNLSHADYTVGWVSAIPIEMAAANAMLDKVHPNLPSPQGDENTYILGRIGNHNIAIACLPSGEYGISSAANVAAHLMSTFPAIRFGLMVGIGGGIWTKTADIRLGDVVIGHPAKTHGGVIQYDFGKALTGGQFERIGMLNRPPQILLTAVAKLRSHHATDPSRIPEFLSAATSSVFARPQGEDRLYESSYPHILGEVTCNTCDATRTVKRHDRDSWDPVVHYGLVLSGNQVIKDSCIRDELAAEEGLCVEMEAAGLLNTFPCLVIRGICDYADSHKNKGWQGYAAAVAAAYAKELLLVTPAPDNLSKQRLEFDKTTLDAIEKLPIAENAAYNSSLGETKPFCLPNTRVEILRAISDWCQDDTSPCIFWLSGMAGTGKSTIARTVAENFSTQGNIAVSFFFSRGGGDLASPVKFVTTLAAQLANRQPLLKWYIGQAIQSNPEVISEGLASQWRQLILEPMKKLGEEPFDFKSFTVTIDALDECEGEEDVTRILNQLSQFAQIQKLKIRVFITSRPETRIRVDFGRMADSVRRQLRLHDIESSITEGDIRVYLSHALGEIARYRTAPPGWPGENEVHRLAAQASGLFIYAATACRFISKKHRPPADLLALFLNNSQGANVKSAHKSLDSLYIQIVIKSLFGSFEDDDEDIREEIIESFKDIVGPILLLFDTLPISAYSNLIDAEETHLVSFLAELSSVLDIPEDKEAPIQLLHPSFRDFLTSSNRCPAEYLIDGPEIHKVVAEACIRHILMSNIELFENGRLHNFLKVHLLHWLEAQSWMGDITASFQDIVALQARVGIATGKDGQLYRFLEESRRFVLANRYITDNAPLQLYLCTELDNEITTRPSIMGSEDPGRTWGREISCISPEWGTGRRGHNHPIRALHLADKGLWSASNDNTIGWWDVDSGELIKCFAGPNDEQQYPLIFRHDGSIIWGSAEGNIFVEDLATGVVAQSIKAHEARISLLAVSCNEIVASYSYGFGIKLWDLQNGTLIKAFESPQLDTTPGRSTNVRSLNFSPDGLFLASSSITSTKIWNLVTGEERILPLPEFGSLIKGASFNSYAGSWELLSWGGTKINLQSSPNREQFKNMGDVVCCAASTEGSNLAAGSDNGVIQLHGLREDRYNYWSYKQNTVYSITVLPFTDKAITQENGKCIIWGTVIWDTLIFDALITVNMDYSGSWDWAPSTQRVVIFSPKSSPRYTVVSLETGGVLSRLGSQPAYINGWTLSPDGEMLAEVGLSSIKIYHVMTGVVVHTVEIEVRILRGHRTNPVFSPDGNLVALWWRDNEILLCNPVSGENIYIPAPIVSQILPTNSQYSPSRESKSLDMMLWYSTCSAESYKFDIASGSGGFTRSRYGPRDAPESLPKRRILSLEGKRPMDHGIASDSLKEFESDRFPPYIEADPKRRRLFELQGRGPPPGSLAWRINVDKNWVTIDQAKMLWLPPYCVQSPIRWDLTETHFIYWSSYGELECIGVDLSQFPLT
ncbi:hypothetical protein FE257_000573 [Aspergillus nanangensis]|uniref:Nucleoside phosphorylase domain-containing protein n=1 Tax=Aspergillus nanangensis TaxID=2582783 RepID=A0AAD4CUJ7_ASPNN|nr:hypothetical protein FE257_000573 [Aspergillus nanangensis]